MSIEFLRNVPAIQVVDRRLLAVCSLRAIWMAPGRVGRPKGGDRMVWVGRRVGRWPMSCPVEGEVEEAMEREEGTLERLSC